MNRFKIIISYSPYLLILLVVVPISAHAEFFSIKGVLWSFVNSVFGGLVGIAGMVLDYAVTHYVVGFGDTWGIGGTGMGGAIDLTWTMVRDMFNIGFIFGLIWLGFKMILRSDDSNTRRTLVTLIIAALLVNFSLYITKFVVDFTNLIAMQIAGAFTNAAGEVEISASFMQLFQLTTVWQSDEMAAKAIDSVSYMYIFGTAMVFMVAAFTFFAGGIMLIIRFAALCIYMVFSPLMFLGFVFPGLKSISSSYWNGFLGRAFFAPTYLMLVYLSAYIMGSYNTSAADFAAAFKGDDPAAAAASIGPFLLICAFLIASVVVASKMSTTGASTAISMGNNIRGRAQRGLKKTAVGTGRFAARQTVGRGARGVSNASERTRRSLDRGLGSMAQGGKWSKRAARTLDNTVGAGLRAGENASVAGSETKAQQRKRVNEQNARLNTVNEQTNRNKAIIEALALAQTNKPDKNKSAEEQEAARKARTDAMNIIDNQTRRMSDEEVLNLDQKTINSPEFAQHLTDSHIKALRGSGKYTNEQARGISTARDKGAIDTISETLDSTNTSAEELSTAFDKLAQNIQNMSVERLAGMDETTLTSERVASNLTEKQIEEMRTSGRFSSEQITKVRAAREKGISAIASGSAPSIVNAQNANGAGALKTRSEKLFQGNSQVTGQLPASVFMQSATAKNITPAALQQRMRNGLSEENRKEIEENIKRYISEPTPESKRAEKVWQKWADGSSVEGSMFDFNID